MWFIIVNLAFSARLRNFHNEDEIRISVWKSINLQRTKGRSLLSKAEVDIAGIGIEKLLNLHNSYSASQILAHY